MKSLLISKNPTFHCFKIRNSLLCFINRDDHNPLVQWFVQVHLVAEQVFGASQPCLPWNTASKGAPVRGGRTRKCQTPIPLINKQHKPSNLQFVALSIRKLSWKRAAYSSRARFFPPCCSRLSEERVWESPTKTDYCWCMSSCLV